MKTPLLLCRSARLFPVALTCLFASGKLPAQQTTFTPGNLVVAVEGCGVYGGTCTVPNGTGTAAGNSALGGYGDNQASPLTLFQFSPVGTSSVAYVNSLSLPQTVLGANLPVSAEYGSSSEATLQLSGNGQYLTILGYGVSAASFNIDPTRYGAAPSLALGQSQSLTGQTTTAVPRVLALIDSRGNVSSSTALFNIFNANNPRSAFTADGTSVYASGQGTSGDKTGGVFSSRVGALNTAPTPITGLDTSNNTASQDTRTVQIVNNTLVVSVDTKAGSGAARDFLGTLGTAGAPPTATVGGPVMLPGYGNSGGTGRLTIAGNGNGLNEGLQINLSPNNFFFASPSVLYVADGGNPKNNSGSSSLGDGGLQKWINSSADGSGTWTLAYTLATGLHLVPNTAGTGSSGLFGLAGRVQADQVLLYATDFTLNDLDATFLYGITDSLGNTSAALAAGETFTTLAAAPKDSNFKGVSFAPNAAPVTNLQVSAGWIPLSTGYGLTISVFNAGSGTVQDVTLTGVTVGGFAAASLPVTLGPLGVGKAVTTVIPVPASVGAPTQGVIERITGSYTGGTFGSTQRAQLPQNQ